MNCLEFERLLDEGEPERLPADALAHVAGCASCARSRAIARSLERALERHFAAVPAGDHERPSAAFTDRVMARVERVEARGARWLVLPDALPWWVRAAAEPGVALACALAALLLWRGDAIVAQARAWLPALAGALPRLSAAWQVTGSHAFVQTLAHALLPGPGAPWTVALAMALALAPVMALVAWGLWRLAERWAESGGIPVAR